MKHSTPSALLALTVLATACGSDKTSPQKEEYDKWKSSLTDSIAVLQQRSETVSDSIETLHAEVGSMLEEFTHVSNPREVEGYTIAKGWEKRYPLTSTGLVARITEDETFELIATLRGGNFDRIEVSDGTNSTPSATVPHDQALNYRSGGLNTVAFTGPEAEAIGELISSAKGKVSVSYLATGKTGGITLPAEAASMIGATWRLVSTQHKAERLERELPLISRKIEILRRMADNKEQPAEEQEKQ